MIELEIKNISTKDLVEELSGREGVEKFSVPVEGTDAIIIDEKDNNIEDARGDGPAIILRIID